MFSLSNFASELTLIGVVHVLRLMASGPMYIVFRLLPLLVVWLLLFWFCFCGFWVFVHFGSLRLYNLNSSVRFSCSFSGCTANYLVQLFLVSFIGDCDHPVARACRGKKKGVQTKVTIKMQGPISEVLKNYVIGTYIFKLIPYWSQLTLLSASPGQRCNRQSGLRSTDFQ